MSNTNKYGLVQNKFTFVIRGRVTGVKKDCFFKELFSKTGKEGASVTFGLQTSNNAIHYMTVQGWQNDYVCFGSVDKNIPIETKRVPWKDRLIFKDPAYRLIGNSVNLTTDKDNEQILTDYDMALYLAKNLQDDMELVVIGTITKKDKYVTLVPKTIRASQKNINFDDDKYTPQEQFSVEIITDQISKKDNYGVLTTKLIGYSTIEDLDFIIKDNKLLSNLSKLKKYTYIKAWGNIETTVLTEEIVEDDGWGVPDPTKKITGFNREFVITGADPSTVDKDLYTADDLEEIMAKIQAEKLVEKDFGKKSNNKESTNNNVAWGNANNSESEDFGDLDSLW